MNSILSISFFFVLLSISFAFPERSGPVQTLHYNFNYTGGIPGCKHGCSGSDRNYACSSGIGEWNKGELRFESDVGSNYMAKSIQVMLIGNYNCNFGNRGVINVTINNIPVSMKTPTSTSRCECDTCDGKLFFENDFYIGGFPNISTGWGSSNLLKINLMDNDVCIHKVSMSVNFTEKYPLKTHRFSIGAPESTTKHSTCTRIIAGSLPNYRKSLPADFSFSNPLPTGSKVIAINTRAYYANPTSASNVKWQMRLNGQLFGETTAFEQSYSCSTIQSFDTYSKMFMSGIPGYNYNSPNTIVINTPPSLDKHFGLIEVELIYI